MEKKYVSLFLPVFWSILTVIWTVIFLMNLSHQTAPIGLLFLQGICAAANLHAAISSIVKYRKNRVKDH